MKPFNSLWEKLSYAIVCGWHSFANNKIVRIIWGCLLVIFVMIIGCIVVIIALGVTVKDIVLES
ncbi:MAG: hypothetical protein V1707_00605 [bacterium]